MGASRVGASRVGASSTAGAASSGTSYVWATFGAEIVYAGVTIDPSVVGAPRFISTIYGPS